VFTWEAVWGVHAWVALGAAAMVTERIRLEGLAEVRRRVQAGPPSGG